MVKNPHPEYFPLSVRGLSWNSSSQNPCIYLVGGFPEVEIVIDLDPLEAGDILRYLDRSKSTAPLTHDLLVKLFVRNGYALDGLFLREGVNGLTALLRCRKGEVVEEWDVRPSDGLALSLRMNFPIFAHGEVLSHFTVPPGIPSRPDVLC